MPKITYSGDKMHIYKLLCSLLLLHLVTSQCFSQNIGNWAFSNTATGTGGTYNTVSTAAFSSGITSTAYNANVEFFGEGGWPSGALNTNAYLQFSISPNTGYQLDLSGLILRLRHSTTGAGSGSGPTQWSLRSSRDGYTSDLASGTLTNSYNDFSVSLSGFLNIYTTVTFRLYGYTAVVTSGGLSRLVVDNISIQGIGAVLPLQLTGVQANRDNSKNVAIKWQVANVQEGTHFHVRRSINGTDFTDINSFTEQQTQNANSYSYTDADLPAGTPQLYYRIEAKEPSGWTLVSWLVSVNNKTNGASQISYTTVQGQSLVTSLQVTDKGPYTLMIVSANGALLQKRSVNLEAGTNVINLPLSQMAHGTYAISLMNNGLIDSKRFVY